CAGSAGVRPSAERVLRVADLEAEMKPLVRLEQLAQLAPLEAQVVDEEGRTVAVLAGGDLSPQRSREDLQPPGADVARDVACREPPADRGPHLAPRRDVVCDRQDEAQPA